MKAKHENEMCVKFSFDIQGWGRVPEHGVSGVQAFGVLQDRCASRYRRRARQACAPSYTRSADLPSRTQLVEDLLELSRAFWVGADGGRRVRLLGSTETHEDGISPGSMDNYEDGHRHQHCHLGYRCHDTPQREGLPPVNLSSGPVPMTHRAGMEFNGCSGQTLVHGQTSLLWILQDWKDNHMLSFSGYRVLVTFTGFTGMIIDE